MKQTAMPDGDAPCVAELLDPGVRSVQVMLTTACNLRCVYCYQQRKAPRIMAPDLLDASIRQLVSSCLDRPRLTLFGGEPLLAAPLVRRALDRVRDWAPPRMKPDVHILTNGTRLDEEMIRLLVSRDVALDISFDGIAPAQDDRSPGTFEILDRLLVRLKRNHPKYFRSRVAVKATLTSRNVPHLAASFRYFLSREVRDVDVVAVLPGDAGWNAHLAQELDRQLAEVVDLSLKECRRSGEVPFRPFRASTRDLEGDGGPACACGSRGLVFVDVDGALAPCAAFAPSTFGARPRTLRHVLSTLGGLHVTDRDLPAALIRREKRARRLRLLAVPADRRDARGACARCTARPTCLVCPIAVASNDGRVPAFHCDVNRLFGRRRAELLHPSGHNQSPLACRPLTLRPREYEARHQNSRILRQPNEKST